MPTARIQMKANVVNGKIYLIGGRTGGQYSTVALNEVYDPAHNSWTTKAAVPYPVVDYAFAVVKNKMYLIGGQDEFLHESMDAAFNKIYDVETDSWSQGAPIPVAPLIGAAGATTGKMAPKRIYVIGGARGIGVHTNSNYVYDPQLDVWSTAADMPTARMGSAVATARQMPTHLESALRLTIHQPCWGACPSFRNIRLFVQGGTTNPALSNRPCESWPSAWPVEGCSRPSPKGRIPAYPRYIPGLGMGWRKSGPIDRGDKALARPTPRTAIFAGA